MAANAFFAVDTTLSALSIWALAANRSPRDLSSASLAASNSFWTASAAVDCILNSSCSTASSGATRPPGNRKLRWYALVNATSRKNARMSNFISTSPLVSSSSRAGCVAGLSVCNPSRGSTTARPITKPQRRLAMLRWNIRLSAASSANLARRLYRGIGRKFFFFLSGLTRYSSPDLIAGSVISAPKGRRGRVSPETSVKTLLKPTSPVGFSASNAGFFLSGWKIYDRLRKA